jgi:hypothetical protein
MPHFSRFSKGGNHEPELVGFKHSDSLPLLPTRKEVGARRLVTVDIGRDAEIQPHFVRGLESKSFV